MSPSWLLPSRARSSPPERPSAQILSRQHSAPGTARGDWWAQCVWGHQGCHQICHPQMSCLRITWTSQTEGFFFFFFYFLFLQSHTLGGRNLELSKIGCVPVFRPVPYPPLWKSLMVKKTLSHIIRSTRKMALVQFLKGKSCIFPKHIWLHHSLNGHSISY